MKKVLPWLLAVFMVIVLTVTAIFTVIAAGDTISGADDANFRIGNQYYSTLKAALTDAKDGDTIEVLKNVDDPTTANLGTYSKNLTINGNGHTYTAKKNSNAYLFYLNGDKTITINNLNMEVQSGFGISGKGVINLNDCYILATHRMAVRTSSATDAEFNIHNTTLEINGTGGQPLVYLDATTKNIINITGTSKLIRRTSTVGDIGNSSVINIVSGSGYTEVNLGSQAEIVMAHVTGNANAPHGIYNNGNGLAVVNLEAGSTFKIDSAIDATPYFFYSRAAAGFAINDEGCNFLVSSSRSKTAPGTYLSDFTVWEQCTSSVSGYVAYTSITPVASGSTAKAAIDAGNVIRYYKGGVQYTNDIKTANTNADDGSVIHVLGNFTQTSSDALVNVTKKVSFSGYGHTLYFNHNTDGGKFPLTFRANSAVANFSKIYATTGVINVKSGTVAFTNILVESGNRAALKYTDGGTATILIKDSEIATSTSTGTTEAPVILEGSGSVNIFLREGAVFNRKNATKGKIRAFSFFRPSNMIYQYYFSKKALVLEYHFLHKICQYQI